MMTVVEFGESVRAALSTYLDPGIVHFRGSLATDTFDEFSDIDLLAWVSVPLDDAFFIGLETLLKRAYGPALVRYDPDYQNITTAQDVRFSFYDLSIFWRVDLLVNSDRDSGQKYPAPFPDWAVGTSALMNVIWALKYSQRGRSDRANHYIGMACEKLKMDRLSYTSANAVIVVRELAPRADVDGVLLARADEMIGSAAG
jgi:hypothetical protein